jgi:hypothetical protein
VGRNYLDHIREMKEADERDPPFFFQKPRDSVVPDGARVPYPAFTEDFQFEVELVLAIGRGGRDIAVEDALDHIWGYAVGIDPPVATASAMPAICDCLGKWAKASTRLRLAAKLRRPVMPGISTIARSRCR